MSNIYKLNGNATYRSALSLRSARKAGRNRKKILFNRSCFTVNEPNGSYTLPSYYYVSPHMYVLERPMGADTNFQSLHQRHGVPKLSL